MGHAFLSRVMWSGCSADAPETDTYYSVIYVLATGLVEPDDPFLSSVFLYILSTFADLDVLG